MMDSHEIPCAGTAQDGEFRAGLAWPNPRFVDNDDGTVTDNLTDLMWAKDSNLIRSRNPEFDHDVDTTSNSIAGDGKVTWQHALDYIRLLNAANFARHNDWRLPNVAEIGTLDFTGTFESCDTFFQLDYCLNDAFLGFPPTGGYWSSTTTPWRHDEALWQRGASRWSYPKQKNLLTWPVRGTTAGETAVASTGQKKCFSETGAEISCAGTGQDGEIQGGIAWPEARFLAGVNTITDAMTGLMWPKNVETPGPSACSPGVQRVWRDVPAYLRCLNSEGYLGYSDWRIPNIVENTSLANWSTDDHQSWFSSIGFSSAPGEWWSSTRWDPGMMWVGIDVTGGWDIFPGYHGTVTPVRGGSFPPLPQFIVSGAISGFYAGKFTCTPGLVTQGENSTCRINLLEGTHIAQLIDNGNDVTSSVGPQNTYVINNVRENHDIRAVAAGDPVTVTITIGGQGAGRVTSTPAGVDCSTGSASGCSAVFAPWTMVTFLAEPNAGSSFAGWDGNCPEGINTCSIFVCPAPYCANKVTASFKPLVRARIGSKDYGSLTEALADAASGTAVLARNMEISEDLVMSQDAVITLDGGYDETFSSNEGKSTILQGALRVTAGTLKIRNLVLR
jgi:hypothetical protein